jgi:NAD(P)-dependent dehydrogenase (short-subunit alcohol dehydrogenase family)
VAVTDCLDSDGQALADDINSTGGIAGYWHLDVADEDHVKFVMTMIADRFGSLDVLVNNAGIAGVDKPTHEVTEAEWDAVMAVNLKGVFFCTKHALPHMMRKKSGSIINLSSIYGLVGAADSPPYHASKGGVRLMSKTDALLYAPYGIRVNSVHPGFIWTPMVEGYLRSKGGDIEDGRKAIGALHPLGHMGEAKDVAYGVLYLASDESKFVTGAELVIDGGYTAR